MLLAHLLHAGMHNSKPENVATEALGHVLGKSAHTRAALLSYPAIAALGLHDDLVFLTLVHGDDSAIPDVVGTDGQGRPILIIEAKSWAGLTDNQPVAYLKRLPEQANVALRVVAPANRFETPWSELQRRCILAGTSFAPKPSISSEVCVARVNDIHLLVLVSWRSLLERMSDSPQLGASPDVAADVFQLRDLCAQMVTEAFVPLHAEELSEVTPKR